MHRRTLIRGLASVAGVTSLAGCSGGTDSLDSLEDAGEAVEALEELSEVTEVLEGDAEEAVEDATDGLERPPGADLEVDADGTITVMGLDANTVGVKCGPIEGDDPVEEVRTHEKAADRVGETIEGCDADTVVAVSEGGSIEVVERL